MTHPTTLPEALEMVPVYVMLPYGGKRYMERIPVPQEVREAMAKNLLLANQRGYAMTNPFETWLLSQGD